MVEGCVTNSWIIKITKSLEDIRENIVISTVYTRHIAVFLL